MSLGIATKSILLVLGGAAIGATAALLTAPMSGRDTRRKLKQLSGTLVHRARRVAPAIQKATVAGKEAFAQSMNASNLNSHPIAPPHH